MWKRIALRATMTASLLIGGAAAHAAAQPPGVLGMPSGTGSLPAVAELRADLPTHTIYRPVTLPKTPLPLYVWATARRRDN